MKRQNITSLTIAACAMTAAVLSQSGANGQTLADYTAYPNFVSQQVPPNILFLVDLGDLTIQAAYGGNNHHYPVSFKSGAATASQFASNVTFDGTTGVDLVAVDSAGAVISTATTASPSDTFDASKSYYGAFDSLRCYVTDSNSFNYGSVKSTVSEACAADKWDGNFLNWLTMRKKDVAYQALIGGTSKPASANTDGTANSLASEDKTGENGSTDTCTNNSKSCWRYVKFVPAGTLTGRVPTGLPNPAVSGANVADSSSADPGRFLGSGEGKLYVNDDGTPDPFDAAPGNQYKIQVDLTTEPDVPSGTGSENDHCNEGEPGFAGHLVCYKRENSLGLFQKLQLDNMHVGVMFVNSGSGQAAKVQFEFDDTFNPASITGIRNEHIQTHSPLAEALYEAQCLFRKSQGPCYANSGSSATGYDTSTGVAGDPFFFVDFNQIVACCKSFVLMISPGVPTSDGNSPDLQVPFGDPFPSDSIGLAASRLDDIAHYGKTNDVRGDVTGDQTVTFYAVNAMGGSGGTLLASAAKYGGFEDQNGDQMPDAGSQACTYPAGSSLGSGPATSSPEWDKNQDCIPDTYFEASDGGDLEAQVNLALADILKRAASGSAVSVLASSSTGEGALYQSFFFPTTFEGLNEIKWIGYTQGLFLDAFGNLREDTNGDGRLVYDQDMIIRTRLDTTTNDVLVDRFQDTDGNGLEDGPASPATIGLRDVKAIWEAGAALANRNDSAQPRTILTWLDADHNGEFTGAEKTAIDFTTANATTLAPYLRAEAAPSPYSANAIINFIRGCEPADCPEQTLLRNRRLDVGGSLKTWKLGDVIHSQPILVGAPGQRYDVIYGDPSYSTFFNQYKDRRQVAYVGANDGMLHAFNAGYFQRGDDPGTGPVEHGYFCTKADCSAGGRALGEELFGFIPQELLPHLKWLTRPDYTHVYYVDLKPKVTDARIFAADADHPNGWGTILIGGFRLGGSCGNCVSATGAPPMQVTADFDNDVATPDESRTFYSAYFVLDITNPESSDYPKLIWSFSSAEVGLTTMIPSMLRVHRDANTTITDNSDAAWYLIAGSGPTGYEAGVTQSGKLYAINLADGPGPNNNDVETMSAETLNAFMGSTLTIDRDFDYRVEVTYMGSVINDGSLPWRGKLVRLTMNTCAATPCSPTVWGIDDGPGKRVPTEILDTFSDGTNTVQLGPIAATPAVAIDDANNLWVFAGTGRFYSQADKTNTEQQYFVGVKDSVLNFGCTQSSRTNCHDNDLVNVSDAEVCIVGTGDCGSGTDQVTNVTGATDFPSLLSLVAGKDGWMTTLPGTGERALARPAVFGGIVLFPTFTPEGDICSATGNSSLYGLYYRTGGPYSEPVIGTEAKGGKDYVRRSTDMGPGLSTEAVMHVGSSGKYGKARGLMQNSLGQVFQIDVTTGGIGITSRFLSWSDVRT